ncbi:helix-turn-helix transcriptional regulator [Pseudomonadota bacterium]
MTTLIRLPLVIARTGLSRSTIYAKIKDETFPAPIQLGLRAVGWIDNEVSEWIEARISQARSGSEANG